MPHTFVFVDLAGFTALTEAHGDETGADLVDRFVSIVRVGLEGDGRLVGVNGDAVFFVAPDPVAALRAVTRIFERTAREVDFPALRAGLHHGEAAARDGQFYGTAVNIAARVAAHATSGRTLGTREVAEAARSMGRAVDSLGRVTLKNLREPIELFSIAMGDDASDAIDPVCRMRIASRSATARLKLADQEHLFCSWKCLQTFVAALEPGEGT